MKKTINKYGLQWGLLTGILMGTSYPPFPAWALLFAFVPLWLYWWKKAENLKQVFWSGFVAQFTLMMIGFNWVFYVAREFGHIPPFFSFLILLIFCAFGALHVVFAGLIVCGIRKRFPMNAGGFFLTLATFTGLLEWTYPQIFPWNLGYSLFYSHLNIAQTAELIGFAGISFVIFVLNGLIALAVSRYPEKSWKTLAATVVLILLVGEAIGYGLKARIQGTEDASLNVLLVQPNIGNYEKHYQKFGGRYQGPVVRTNLELIRQGLRDSPQLPNLVVLPETAYPQALDQWFLHQPYAREFVDFVQNSQTNFIVGAYSRNQPFSQNARVNFNAMFGASKDGKILPPYRKHILLAFGEYIPGGQYFPWVYNLVPNIGNFARGDGPATFSLEGINYSPLICYESLDPLYVSDSTNPETHIYVNVTNDSWFGTHFEPFQHMSMAIARTIEFRRPMIRATNTGISTIADMTGKMLISGPQNVEWTGGATLRYRTQPTKTVYQCLAPWMTWIFVLIAAITLAIAIRRGRGKVRT